MLTRRQLLETRGRRIRAAGTCEPVAVGGNARTGARRLGPRRLGRRGSPRTRWPTRPGHFPAKAKRVIWFFVNGGPSHVDTWDFKPALAKWDGKSIKEFDPGFKNTTGFFKDAVGGLMKSPFRFSPRGECGKMVSEIFPEPGRARRQDGVHPLGVHRVEQPLAGALHDEHGLSANGISVRRLVGDLRPGKRDTGPSRLRRDERPAGPRAAQGPRGELGRGVSAGRLPGNALCTPRARRSTTSSEPPP